MSLDSGFLVDFLMCDECVKQFCIKLNEDGEEYSVYHRGDFVGQHEYVVRMRDVYNHSCKNVLFKCSACGVWIT